MLLLDGFFTHLDQTPNFDVSQLQVLLFSHSSFSSLLFFFSFPPALFFLFPPFPFVLPLSQILVLDEADRILDLGFSNTMKAILEHLPQFSFLFFSFFFSFSSSNPFSTTNRERQTLLFSATQSRSVRQLANLSLKVFVLSFLTLSSTSSSHSLPHSSFLFPFLPLSLSFSPGS